ncbi:MAG: M20/M25/M40 family metallo-hydrolase, partial [Pseudomonadota bacterium]
RLRAEAEAIAADLGLEIAFEQTGHFEPVAFDPGCLAAIRRAVARHGYSSMDLISGAGHDACWINRVAPTAMIMTPCKDGLSHNEDESITQEEAAAGTNVLLDAVVETAEIAP